MPVLSKHGQTKKIVLPVASKDGDEAWVEAITSTKIDLLYGIDLHSDELTITVKMLPRIIKSWNFSDEQGNPLPINEETVKWLDFEDMGTISKESGLDDKFKRLSKDKKRGSLPTLP